jgi:hypothetical protein
MVQQSIRAASRLMQNGATNFIIISSSLGAEIDGSPHAEY